MPYNKPCSTLTVGMIAQIFLGFVLPVFGYLIMKCIFAMSPPVGPQCLDNNTPENEKVCDDIKADVNKWSGIMIATAAAGGILAFFGKYSFALLGENITFGVR
jgi:hypothetical protein